MPRRDDRVPLCGLHCGLCGGFDATRCDRRVTVVPGKTTRLSFDADPEIVDGVE